MAALVLVLACALWLVAGPGTAPASAERLPLRAYTTADGLARDEMLRIVRDSRGFLWFCTFEGLSRFDGYTFINYTTAEGLPHRSIRDLLETRTGDYWVATGAGVARLNLRGSRTPQGSSRASSDALFRVYLPGQTEASRSIWKLYQDPRGRVWVGTLAGLYELEESGGGVAFRFTDLKMPSATIDDRWVEDLHLDREGALWVATRAGLYQRLPDGGVERYTMADGLPSDGIHTIHEDQSGRVWIGSSRGLAVLAPKPRERRRVIGRVYTDKDGLPGPWINDLLQSGDGTMWITTNRGLGVLAPPASLDGPVAIRSYSRAHGLSGLELGPLAEDRDRNLWIGVPGHGAMKLARNGFVTYGEADGLGTPVVGSILLDRTGQLCVFGNDRLKCFDGRRFVSFRPAFGNLAKFTWASGQLALQDRAGRWWFATGQGLYRFPSVKRPEDLARVGPEATYTDRDGLPGNVVFNVYEDRVGGIWTSTLSGDLQGDLMRWEPATERFYRFTTTEGWTPGTQVHAFAEDAAGTLWITTGNGLARYRNGRFDFLTTVDGLPTNAVTALHVDEARRLWVSTDTAGVVRVDDPSAEHPAFRTYSMAQGLASNQTYSITSDRGGHIYIGTGRGVDRLDPGTGQIKSYSVADGLAATVASLSFRDREGALWFGTNWALSRLADTRDETRRPSPVWISGLRIGGVARQVPELGVVNLDPLQVEPDERQLSIDFFSLAFGAGERLRYQYQLAGADADWSAPTDQRTIHYAGLSPGTYRFLVRAVSTDGWVSPPASASFTIPPPIWLRWWFLALTGLSVALGLYTGHRYRVRRLLEIERVRTRIATDLHDDLGASLSRMAILSEVVKRQIRQQDHQSVSLLNEIADSARNLVGSLRDIVWAIDARSATLSDVIVRVRQFTSDVLDPKGIAWQLDAGDRTRDLKVDPESRRHVLLFFKEAIHNVVRHSECRSVQLSIDDSDHQLICEVRDDGRGFDTTPDAGEADASGGRGLRNMRARAAQLGGDLQVRSAAGGGTHLRMVVPARGKHA